MAKKKEVFIKKYHNGNREKNQQIIFLRMQAIREERGLVSRIDVRDNLSKEDVRIDDYRDIYGSFAHITYLTKIPLSRKNSHKRARTPRPAYDLSIRLRGEKRKTNQKYRNHAELKIQESHTQPRKVSQMPYSVYITQKYMPPCWKDN